MEDIYNHTAITYPNTYVREMSGETIKNILEDVADNILMLIRICSKEGIWLEREG